MVNKPPSADRKNLGILHPGEMGLSVAASAQNSGHTVYWVSAGRSAQTAARAARIGLQDAQSLANLCKTCSIIVSVCPPDAAETVATSVLSQGFKGLYADLNAISPQRVAHIGGMMGAYGIHFVDGAIIGGPAWKPNTTWLYLSGEQAQSVAECFSAGPLGTSVIGDSIGKASALKMCYAAYTKGTTALLCAVLAASELLDVRTELEHQWTRDDSNFAAEASEKVRKVTAKAWRFAGEMDEIAATLSAAGVPGEFHAAAADIYRRMTDFKDAPTLPALDEVLAALLQDARKVQNRP